MAQIFLLETDHSLASLTCENLRCDTLSIEVFDTHRSLINKLSTHPELILADFGGAQESGFGLLKFLRRFTEFDDIKFVFYTSFDLEKVGFGRHLQQQLLVTEVIQKTKVSLVELREFICKLV